MASSGTSGESASDDLPGKRSYPSGGTVHRRITKRSIAGRTMVEHGNGTALRWRSTGLY